MMGFGSYGGNAYGGGSSNLSALAPPFTVDRSIPKLSATPLVDLGEPLNWLDTNPYTFNSPQPAQHLDPIPTSSYNQSSDLFEPKTYTPSYVSPPLHVPTFNEQSLSGLDHTVQWSVGSWDWVNGNPAQLGGSFYSKETNVAPSSIFKDHINLGIHPTKRLNTCEETSHNFYSLGREKQVGSPSIHKLDYNPVSGQNLSLMPVGYSNTLAIGSSSALPEADLQVPSLNLVNCKINQVPFNIPYEKPVRQHDMSGNYPSNVKEPHYSLNFGSKNEFDSSQLSYHLDGNFYLYGESSATMTEKLSTSNMASKDASDHLFRTKSGVTFPHIGPDNFSSALDNNEGFIAAENALENLDHFNPVDSPCWRGAPSSHNSPFGSSEAVSVQLEKKPEACDDSNCQELKFIPMNSANMVRLPSGKPGEIRMNVENGNVEDGSVSCLKLPSISIMPSRDHQPDVAGKEGSYHRETSSACKIKYSDNASEWKKNNVLFNKSEHEVEKASCSIGQNLAEGRLASKNLLAFETGVSDLEMKINDVSGCGSSCMSCLEVNSLSCSPSSIEDVSTQQSKFFGKEPVSNNSISVLLDTMLNLSKLLLYNCSNKTCELKEQDIKSLEKVINNLDSCMSKHVGQESIFSELHEGTSLGRPQVAAIDVWNQHVPEKTKHSGKQDEKCSDFIPVKSGTDVKARNDKMTQAIKKVLVDNFYEKDETHPQVLLYKNLWLEAEAALCSINYLARFNKIKIEIEKCKLDSEKDLSEDASDEDKISSSKYFAEVNTNRKLTALAESGSPTAVSNQNSPIESSSFHADDVTARFQELKQRLNYSSSVRTRDVDELSSFEDGVDQLATEVKDYSILGLSSEDSLVQGTACQTDDVETSIMARFHILKNHDFNNLDFNEMARKLLPDAVDLGFAGMTKQIPIDKNVSEGGMSGVNLESVSRHHVTNQAGEQLVVKNFRQCVQHDCTIQSPGSTRLGNQLSSGRYDGCSSDWEHVLKEEFSGQNS